MRYRLDPELVIRANKLALEAGSRPLTERQIEAVETKIGLDVGYRTLGLRMGISREGAKDHYMVAMRKLERAYGQEFKPPG